MDRSHRGILDLVRPESPSLGSAVDLSRTSRIPRLQTKKASGSNARAFPLDLCVSYQLCNSHSVAVVSVVLERRKSKSNLRFDHLQGSPREFGKCLKALLIHRLTILKPQYQRLKLVVSVVFVFFEQANTSANPCPTTNFGQTKACNRSRKRLNVFWIGANG